MRIFACSVLSLFLLGPVQAQTRTETHQMLAELHLLDPPWVSPTIYRESTLLLQEENGPLIGRLAFDAEEVLEVRAADGSREYAAGVDFQVGADKRTLEFPANAKVPHVKTSELFVPLGSPDSYAHRTGNSNEALLFRPGRWFHERQLEVTYRRGAADWVEGPPMVAESGLPRTLARLRAGQPVKIVVAGDSISAGGDASLHADVAPMMPAFPELVAAQLEEHYGSEITLKNLAVGGTSVHNGVVDLQKYVDERPDLLIVGFGMNDVGRRDPAWFKAETEKLVRGAREALPEVEVLLVSPMIGNAEWVHTPREMFPQYRDVLAELAGPGVALADVTAAWELLLKNKHDLDMIGNGLNHPNDFGHRVYAQTILGLLVPMKGNE